MLNTLAIVAITLASPTDHSGFSVRGQLGIGGAAATSEIDLTNTDITFRGGCGWVNVEAGGALVPGTILFGKVYALSAPDPSLKVGDTTFDTNISGYFRGIGAGLTHYFMPSNFYLTGALTVSQLGSRTTGGSDYDSGAGLMLHVGAGIELFVAPELALGVGAEVAYGGFPDQDIDPDGWVWGGGYGVIAFNVTYN